MKVNIGVSNRHVHLSKEVLEILFGDNFDLSVKNNLTQPGEFASNSVVAIKTDKDIINNVRVLGPVRDYTQVEISKTDAYKLGINPPVRESGDLDGSEAVTLIGSCGSVNLDKGCIIATRHIHISESKIQELGLQGISKVDVKIFGIKGGIISNVSLKVSDNYCFEMHIDTDDANAHLIKSGDFGEIIK